MQEMLARIADDCREVELRGRQPCVEQGPSHADDAVQRRSELVAHICEERAFGGVRGFGCFLGLSQFNVACLKACVRVQELATCAGQAVARGVEADSGIGDLALQDIETRRHLADLVARVDGDRGEIDAGMCAFQVAATKGLHRANEIGERAGGEAVRGLRHLNDRMGDHAGQHQTDRDREQCDCHEDVFKHGDQDFVAWRNVADRDEVAGAVENKHGHHGSGQFQVKRVRDARKPGAAAVVKFAPCVKGCARVREGEADQDCGKAELLKAEDRRHAPDDCGRDAKFDRSSRRAPRPGHIRLIAAQKPNGNRRQCDADQIGEVRRGDQPNGIAEP